METENPIEASTKLQSEINNNGDGNLVDALTKGQSSRKRTSKSLRAKSKTIEKPSANNSLKSKKAKSSPKSQGRNRKKNKDIIQGKGERNRNEHGEANNLNSSEKNVSKKEHIENGQEIRKNQERFVGSNKGQKNQKSGEKHGVLVDKSSRNQKNKGKLDEKEKNGRDEKKKEKLGGMIFMCSAKTKPDCFLYRVMGVTMNKKELILGVKPGLKLFLYDFDLKLMYGIYEASSAGGVKLETKAFGGSFPFQDLHSDVSELQVRFAVHKDCFPITESVFKKVIKDNYNEKNKFKTEHNVRQVLKLSALFRPVIGPVRSPSMAGCMHRDEFPCDLFMSEKEYRTYGLSGERRKLTPSHHIPSTLDPYQRDQERERPLRQPDPTYRDTVPLQREGVLAVPLYLNQPYNSSGRRELPPAITSIPATSSGSALAALDPYTRDPYYTNHHGASSADAYVPPPRRDELSSGSYYVDGRRETYLFEADPLRRREADQEGRLYSTHASDALSNYNKLLQYHGAKPETAPPSVSSRYSFAGPSVYYR
ncbi:hypothetical protein NC653_012883 [Populus alba x Populus x berolinensis]|uniref:DCD domain-containing protein n=1 Tax=Populus alba x Populus x berolinensis TaxID=444605 RepID=A0AAD6QTG2_9ROSI|nr:hypothetical protein NC653_012883 [Populus alba x Populus x berolinensis]